MRLVIVTALALAATVGSAAAAEPMSGRLAAIPYPLTLSKASSGAEVTPDALRLTSLKGGDLYSPAKGPRADTAPRVTFVPKGDFIFSARVARPHAADYEGGALVVYAGAERWVKLLFERINGTTNAVTSASAAPVSDGAYHIRVAPAVPAMWLKVARSGGSILLYTSTDGADWLILRDVPLDEAAPVTVGFASQSPLGERYDAAFSDIRFEARKVQDYWQGR